LESQVLFFYLFCYFQLHFGISGDDKHNHYPSSFG
jgi:hypothetical protein